MPDICYPSRKTLFSRHLSSPKRAASINPELMNIVHRIYVGARNNRDGKFTKRDIETMEKTLNRYFVAWTWVTSTGCWNGVTEESKIITVTPGGAKKTEAAGPRPIIACANQLRGHFEQEAVMLEVGGPATIIAGKPKRAKAKAAANSSMAVEKKV